NFEYFRNVYVAFAILVLIIVAGTAGFMIIEDSFTLIDAFYMTVITVSTVGFGEIHSLSPEGRLFTSFLIITSFGTFAYAATSITRYLVSGEYRSYFRNFKLNRKMNELSGHVIVCGFGRNGRQAVRTLMAYDRPIVVVENKGEEDAREWRGNHHQVLFAHGDATNEELLIQAGVQKAHALITTLPKDSDNLFVVLTARELNKQLTIISRASETNSDKKLRIAGANNVIMPDKVGGAHMASLVVSPDVIEFLDQIAMHGADEVSLEEVVLGPTNFASLRELEARNRTGVTVVGLKSPEGAFLINPSPEEPLTAQSKLFVLGNREQVNRLHALIKS
ncbi:MAG: potassium channel protein, partial [Bacteroidota bacterium]